MAQPLNVLTSCHGNSSSNSRRRTGFHGCARCKKPTMSLEHLSSQTCIRTLERQLMVWWLYRCLKTKGTMWTANNAQYYSTIHSLRLTSIQAVPDVWLGTKVDSPDDNIILWPPGVDGTFARSPPIYHDSLSPHSGPWYQILNLIQQSTTRWRHLS